MLKVQICFDSFLNDSNNAVYSKEVIMEVVYKILQVLNRDTKLNSSNIVEKIKQEFKKKLDELCSKYDTHEYMLYKEEYELWRNSEFSLNHKFSTGILLHVAAEYGYFNIVRCLKNKGANINIHNRYGYNSLHRAVEDGRIEMVRFLLENDADINANTEGNKKTPLYIAVSKACYIYHEGNADDYKKYVEIIKFLIAKGADVNLTNPLDYAVGLYENIDIVKLLVEEGATITNGHLRSAANDGNTDIVKFLIDKGADVNDKNYQGDTPLHRAAMNSKTDTIKLLIEKGANVNEKNNNKETPLHQVVYNDSIDIIKILIDNGADVNAKDSEGGTPLHQAAVSSDTGTIEFLLQKGAKINVKDDYGRTPLHWVVFKYRHERSVLMLVENGADPLIRDNNGKTPIDYCLKQQQELQCFLDAGEKCGFTIGSSLEKPVFLIKLKQAYNKGLIVRYSTMLLGAAAAYALFATGNVTSDVPHIVGAVAIVTAAALAAERIAYEIFKPSTKMEKVEQEPYVEGYQELP